MVARKKKIGSRRQVWNGTVEKTKGGLKKTDLFKDKYGNIKSKRASETAKRKFDERMKNTEFKKKWEQNIEKIRKKAKNRRRR